MLARLLHPSQVATAPLRSAPVSGWPLSSTFTLAAPSVRLAIWAPTPTLVEERYEEDIDLRDDAGLADCGQLGATRSDDWRRRYNLRYANSQCRRDLASCRNESECDDRAARRSVSQLDNQAKRSKQSEQESQHRETERHLRSHSFYGRFSCGDQRSESSDPARRTHRAGAGAMNVAGRDRAARGGREIAQVGWRKSAGPLGVFGLVVVETRSRSLAD